MSEGTISRGKPSKLGKRCRKACAGERGNMNKFALSLGALAAFSLCFSAEITMVRPIKELADLDVAEDAQVRVGDHTSYKGGAGGGGRIAITYTLNTPNGKRPAVVIKEILKDGADGKFVVRQEFGPQKGVRHEYASGGSPLYQSGAFVGTSALYEDGGISSSGYVFEDINIKPIRLDLDLRVNGWVNVSEAMGRDLSRRLNEKADTWMMGYGSREGRAAVIVLGFAETERGGASLVHRDIATRNVLLSNQPSEFIGSSADNDRDGMEYGDAMLIRHEGRRSDDFSMLPISSLASYQDGEDIILRKRPGRTKYSPGQPGQPVYGNITLERGSGSITIPTERPSGRDEVTYWIVRGGTPGFGARKDTIGDFNSSRSNRTQGIVGGGTGLDGQVNAFDASGAYVASGLALPTSARLQDASKLLRTGGGVDSFFDIILAARATGGGSPDFSLQTVRRRSLGGIYHSTPAVGTKAGNAPDFVASSRRGWFGFRLHQPDSLWGFDAHDPDSDNDGVSVASRPGQWIYSAYATKRPGSYFLSFQVAGRVSSPNGRPAEATVRFDIRQPGGNWQPVHEHTFTYQPGEVDITRSSSVKISGHEAAHVIQKRAVVVSGTPRTRVILTSWASVLD